jgi:hypothetical protein
MTNFATAFVLITVVCMSILPANTFARGRKPSASPRPTAAVDTSDHITATSLTSIIINVYATHQAKEYKVTPTTKITVNGRPSMLHDLAVGMDVTVTPLPNDAKTAAAIDAKIGPRR